MEIIRVILTIIVFAIILRHVNFAYQFKLAMEQEAPELWKSLGKPSPLTYFPWDIKLFKKSQHHMLSENESLRNALTKYENSWKILPVFLIAMAVIDAITK